MCIMLLGIYVCGDKHVVEVKSEERRVEFAATTAKRVRFSPPTVLSVNLWF